MEAECVRVRQPYGALSQTQKVSEFTGTLVLEWDEVEGASLWWHGMMKHITHKTANHNA